MMHEFKIAGNRHSLPHRYDVGKPDAYHMSRVGHAEAYLKRIEVTDFMHRRAASEDWVIRPGDAGVGYIEPRPDIPGIASWKSYLNKSQFENNFGRVDWMEVSSLAITETFGDCQYTVPIELHHIFDVIRESESVLDLNADWDMNGALPIDKTSWHNAIGFLIEYANHILFNYKTVIPAPQIDPCHNGSIDLFWKEPHSQLLINFDAKPQRASYYGDLYDEQDTIKGKAPVKGIKEYLAVWMKSLAS